MQHTKNHKLVWQKKEMYVPACQKLSHTTLFCSTTTGRHAENVVGIPNKQIPNENNYIWLN